MRWLDGITTSMDMNLSNSGRWWRIGRPGVLQSKALQRIGHRLATEQVCASQSSEGNIIIYITTCTSVCITKFWGKYNYIHHHIRYICVSDDNRSSGYEALGDNVCLTACVFRNLPRSMPAGAHLKSLINQGISPKAKVNTHWEVGEQFPFTEPTSV